MEDRIVFSLSSIFKMYNEDIKVPKGIDIQRNLVSTKIFENEHVFEELIRDKPVYIYMDDLAPLIANNPSLLENIVGEVNFLRENNFYYTPLLLEMLYKGINNIICKGGIIGDSERFIYSL